VGQCNWWTLGGSLLPYPSGIGGVSVKLIVSILVGRAIPAWASKQIAPEEPPIGWLLEITLPNVPAGLAAWGDTTGLVPYKRYAVTMECP
jgi:hypothetical protein